MQIITKMLRGKCVYWPHCGDDEFGQPTFGEVVELRCRWEDTVRQIPLADGRTVMSQAKVYVESDVAVGGVLLQKAIVDVEDFYVPFNNCGAFEIMKFDKLPTLKYTQYLRTAWL